MEPLMGGPHGFMGYGWTFLWHGAIWNDVMFHGMEPDCILNMTKHSRELNHQHKGIFSFRGFICPSTAN